MVVKDDNRGDDHNRNDHKNAAELGKHAKSRAGISEKGKLKDFGQGREETPRALLRNILDDPILGKLIEGKDNCRYPKNGR